MTNTRQIILNVLCNIFTTTAFRMYPSNSEVFQMKDVKIVRETANNEIMLEGESQHGVILKSDISLIVYHEDVKLKNTPSLGLYRKGDQIEVEIEDIRNWQVGKRTPMIWRKAEVLSTGLVHPGYGERFKPYPYIEYKYVRTYWKGDSNGNGEFYDKESITRDYVESNVRFAESNLVKI